MNDAVVQIVSYSSGYDWHCRKFGEIKDNKGSNRHAEHAGNRAEDRQLSCAKIANVFAFRHIGFFDAVSNRNAAIDL